MTQAIWTLVENSGSLTERLSALHDHLLQSVPGVDRIACALYDADRDRLKTFINSTRVGQAISGYEYRLADSLSLSQLAESGQFRVLDEIAVVLGSDSTHANWLTTVNRTEAGGYRMGNPEAKVAVIEFVSYTCPHCGKDSDPFGHGGVEAAAQAAGIRFLGRIPLTLAIRSFRLRLE